MLEGTLDHFLHNVLPAANDYDDAESLLSRAFRTAGEDPSKCQVEANHAKRRAAEAAIAIDGLADRAAKELGVELKSVRAQVSLLCAIDGNLRDGCIDRVRAIANAYKHSQLHDTTLPIKSEKDVLVVGAGFGIDGYGLGKFGGIEVMVHQSNGDQRKVLADVPYAIAGWIKFLGQHGKQIPPLEVRVCGMRVNG
ncbi:MAG TPA: hypothetical protein VEU06_02360 [Micropepsaceae bacterium]|nr:hypothetical protein [Micropepsaceae bacterium]